MDGEGAAGAGGGAGFIAVWLQRHREKYVCATRHRFVLSIREGSVDLSSFRRWLGQDYIFVREFVPFVASVLLKGWKESDSEMDVEVILGGMASLHDELSWFKKEASKWDVQLAAIVPQRANRDYCSFLHGMTDSEVDYTTAIVAFWAIETVYQESFALCLEDGSSTPAELLGTCERWGNAGFGQYCQSLRDIAERCLQNASADVLRKAEEAFTQVLEHEVNFWNMSNHDMVKIS
ncbi:hypothetical protein Taro_024281 [Colocasia esculenta]|uniref:aminopyrimidine aminohydrolase n=1 Tax=Colocasia esculenta TaxID=4460 RepID=A0A843V8W2_COLES|nr:hypothetical protein [Colocasia esculenta]